MDNNKPNYYAIIPANIRYDPRLSANQKLLYGEISSLCNISGYCWATNKYFADLYKVSIRSISLWINELAKYGYIKINTIYENDSKIIKERQLFITNSDVKNLYSPIEENFQDNNTRSNITSINNIYRENTKNKSFKKPTYDELKEYSESINFDLDCQNFLDYYESKGWLIGKTKMKDWKAAVRTWKSRSTKNNNNSNGTGNIFADIYQESIRK